MYHVALKATWEGYSTHKLLHYWEQLAEFWNLELWRTPVKISDPIEVKWNIHTRLKWASKIWNKTRSCHFPWNWQRTCMRENYQEKLPIKSSPQSGVTGSPSAKLGGAREGIAHAGARVWRLRAALGITLAPLSLLVHSHLPNCGCCPCSHPTSLLRPRLSLQKSLTKLDADTPTSIQPRHSFSFHYPHWSKQLFTENLCGHLILSPLMTCQSCMNSGTTLTEKMGLRRKTTKSLLQSSQQRILVISITMVLTDRNSINNQQSLKPS